MGVLLPLAFLWHTPTPSLPVSVRLLDLGPPFSISSFIPSTELLSTLPPSALLETSPAQPAPVTLKLAFSWTVSQAPSLLSSSKKHFYLDAM